MERNKLIARKFLDYVNINYKQIKTQFQKYFYSNHKYFDEDIFQDTILKIYNKIEKDGIKDESDEGMIDYFFKALKMNSMREYEYARNKKVDKNVNVFGLIREYKTCEEKVENESYDEFVTNYILQYLQDNYQGNQEDISLFKIKYLTNQTYKTLRELTKIQNCKAKVINVKRFLQETLSKEQINKAYQEYQKNLDTSKYSENNIIYI